MLTRLRRIVRRQIPTSGEPAVLTLRLTRDGEAQLILRRKFAKRGGFTLNLSAAAARLMPGQSSVLPQLGLFAPDASPLRASREDRP